MRALLLLLSLTTLGVMSLTAQPASVLVAGRVYDATSREPIAYAGVQAGDRFTYTDERGRFELYVAPPADGARLPLSITYLGYADTTLIITPRPGTGELRIPLRANAVLPTVEVKAPRSLYGYGSSILTPEISKLAAAPVLAGETDLLKSLVLLPGISTGLEGTASLQLRGGNPSQTHTLLDGNVLYNASHLGGFLSGVDPYGVKGITVYKGGVPARFGGRLSGVVDIQLRDGRRDRHDREFFLGTATARAGFEGPLGENGSYLVSGRFGYPTLLNNLLRVGQYERQVRGSHTTLNIHDGLAKATWYGERSRLSLHAFFSGDDGLFQSEFGFSLFAEDYHWSTVALGASHEYRLGDAWRWTNRVNLSRYRYRFDYFEENNRQTEVSETQNTIQDAALRDLNLRSALQWRPGNALSFETGVEAIRHRFSTEVEARYRNGATESQLRRAEAAGAWQAAAYAQARYTAGEADRLTVDAGLRGVSFSGLAEAPLYWEPRARLSYRLLRGVYFNAGYDRHTQFVHQLTTELTLLPSDIWVLSDDNGLGASRSRQFSAGFGGRLDRARINWSVEAYRKSMDGLLTLRNRSNDLLAVSEDWRERIALDGEGRVAGLEFYLEREGERLSGWLAYTLSRSERRFPIINQGDWYPFTFDRTHDISLTGQYRWNDTWTLGATFVYQTGNAITLPVAATARYFIFEGVNNARTPAYHRLDLSLTKNWAGRKNPHRLHALVFSVYNAYNRANPVTFRVEPSNEVSIDPDTGQEVVGPYKVIQSALFPFLPAVSYRLRFGGPT